MSIQFTSTKTAVQGQGLKFLIYGKAGAGKTYLSSTTGDLERTLIISAEGGMVTLRNFDITMKRVRKFDELIEVYKYIAAGEHDFRWVILDSASEIAEVVLDYEMKRNKDGRAAYGEMGNRVLSLMKKFRDLPYHVVMIAKVDRYDDSGQYVYRPRFPGNKLKDDAPHVFDEMFALRVWQKEDGETRRALMCQSDGRWEIKDRSGALDKYEPPHLADLVAKIESHDADQGADTVDADADQASITV